MRKRYDLMFITKVDTEEHYNGIIDKYRNLIVEGGGTIEKVDKWGRKNLEPIINGIKEADFTLFDFVGENELVKSIANTLKTDEEIIRSMFITTGEA